MDLGSAPFNEDQTLLMLAAEQGWLDLCRHLCAQPRAYLNAVEA